MRYGLAVLAVFSLALLIVGNPARTSDPSLEPDAVPPMRDQASGETGLESTVRPLAADDVAAETTTDANATEIAIPDNARLALLIGNQEYSGQIRDLVRPHEDVRVLQTALEEVGFDVTIALDVDRAGTYARINAFADQLREAGAGVVGFVYYAGHGASIVVDEATGARSNFIIPAGTSVGSERELRQLGVPVIDLVDELNDALEGEPASSLFFITDACRTTIDGASSSDEAGQRGFVVSIENGGYSPLPPRAGLFMANSTLDGQTAPDDGAFADQLAYQITQPEQFAPRAFGLANRDVARIREYGEQLPTISDALTRDVCFVSCPGDANERVRDLLDQQAVEFAMERGSVAQLEFARGNPRLALFLAYDALAPLFDPDGALPLGEVERPNAHAVRRVGTAITVLNAANVAVLESVDLRLRQRVSQPIVYSVNLSPDGTRVVTTNVDRQPRIWDSSTGEPTAVLTGHEFDDLQTMTRSEGLVTFGQFSPDGARVVTSSVDGTARVWDAISGEQIAVLEGHGPDNPVTPDVSEATIVSARFNPGGDLVVTASWDGTARLWDAATGAPRAVLTGHGPDDPGTPDQNEAVVYDAFFSPDGALLATNSLDGSPRIWDGRTGAQLTTLEIAGDGVRGAAAFSPDSQRLLIVSDSTAYVLDADSGDQIAVLEGHLARLTSAVFSPDGLLVMTGSADTTARIWDAATGVQIAVLEGHEHAVSHAAVSSDGVRAATVSSNGIVRLFNIETGAQITSLSGFEGESAIGFFGLFDPDGARVFTRDENGFARLWRVPVGTQVASIEIPDERLFLAAFSPDGSRVATTHHDAVRVWDSESGVSLALLRGHDGGVATIEFSPDGSRVLTAGSDGTTRVWNAESGVQMIEIEDPSEQIPQNPRAATFSPNGTRFVSVSDNTATVWNAENGSLIVALEGHAARLTSAAFSPDGRLVATASTDRTARIWDAATGAQIAVLEGHDGSVYSARFSPDGSRIVTASDDATARVWESLSGGQPIVLNHYTRELSTGPISVQSAAFSSDSSRVLTTSLRTAQVWDATTGEQIASFIGHEGRVYTAAFSSDGLHVVTGSSDRTARIWDAETGAQIAELVGHEHDVESVAFSSDGARIFTRSTDQTVRIWRAPLGPEALLFAVRTRLPRIEQPSFADCRRYDIDCAAIAAVE